MSNIYPYTNTFFDFKEEKQPNDFSIFIPQNKEKPAFNNLTALINGLPKENFAVRFFDYYHPEWSDPGAYITVSKLESTIYYEKGNHGWSSGWYPSNPQRISAYILKNWEHNKIGFSLSTFRYSDVRNPEKIEKIAKEQLTHIRDNLFELNGEVIAEYEDIKYHTDIFDFDSILKPIDFLKLDRIDII